MKPHMIRRWAARPKALLGAATVLLLLIGIGVSVLPASAAGGPNLAAGKPASASSFNQTYSAGNLNDGNQATYWESANNSFPQWAQIDLQASTSVDQIILKLPSGWGARTETLSIEGSLDGAGYSTIVSSAGYNLSPTVTINFPPTNTRFVRLTITANTGWPAGQISEFEIYGTATSSGNLASGKAMSESSHNDVYPASNANDGNQGTYWESANNAFPQWLQVDLGASVQVNKVILKIPSGWAARTETLAVQGSTNGSTFSDIVGSAGYTLSPTATINFNITTTRYVRLNITGNSGWPAGQIAEFEVYGPSGGDTTPPSAPTSLAFTQPQSGQIKLTWNASTDNVGVTGYDIYANNSLRASVNGSTLTFTDTQPDTATVTYFVRAKDAAGNQSANSNSVTRTGNSGDTTPPSAPTNLAFTQPQSGQIKLTWNASTDNVGVTGYDIYANNSLRASVNGSTLTFTDNQPDSATVSYFVRAKDAAGNVSGNSNTVTRNGSGGGTNLALGKPADDNGHTFTYVATQAVDGDVTTYWEGNTSPNTLTVHLGSNADINSVVIKLNPASAWGPRTQTLSILGRGQSGGSYSTIKTSAQYSWDPATGNSVTIPVTATVADVQLQFTQNSGAPGGQVAELQVIGVPSANPDLTITGMSFSPTAPVETDAITLNATVQNVGTLSSAATTVDFSLGTTVVGSANVGALAAGAQTTVSVNIGTRTAGSYTLSAKVDPGNGVIEQNESNNSFTNSGSLVVTPVQSSDLIAQTSWTPSNPSSGNAVSFSVAIKNQGTIASGSGSHGITLTVKNDQGSTVATLTGSVSGTIASGATSSPVNLGTWTAANGRYTVHVVLAVDSNEVPVKQGNNTSDTPLFVGRGANLPYDMYEAEDGSLGGGASVIGPNRTIGDPAGEASGRKAVTLGSTGSFVEWTTKASTNTLVVRYSMPDAAGGGGQNSTLDIYIDGTFSKSISLTSRFAWLYGAEAGPSDSPSAGAPRHIYDEANVMLDASVPAGHHIRLQKDSGNSLTYNIDFINLEQVSPLANPDPAHYKVPAGFTHQNVQDALDFVRMDTTGTWLGVYLPPGTYDTSQKLQIFGKAIKVVGAGVWYTRFQTPLSQSNTDAGFAVASTASGSSFSHLAFFGNYIQRIDGPGKVWGELQNVDSLNVDDVWVEHTVCGFWGVHATNWSVSNARIRDTFADGINLTNGSTGNHVFNSEARATGDDGFALFSATDAGASTSDNGNLFENLNATLTWRAAGLAVYGGFNNTFRNLYIADMLTYSGITISSLDFGFPFIGFGSSPPTQFQNISLVRDGGHFWGNQTFGAIWCFAASKEFRGIRVSDVDIVDPTYSGIMFQSKYPEQQPITDTIFTRISISGAQRSGDAFDAKSGFGIWVNELPETGQGPAIGSATFNTLTFSNNFQNIKNTTSTFTLTINP